MKYVLDTYAWIEYFRGSNQGKRVRRIIEAKEHILITLENCIAELCLWALRENVDFKRLLSVVERYSHIDPIYLENWIEAAEIRHRRRKRVKDFGMMDALILSKQKDLKCKLVTGDKHFRALKDVVFLA